MKLFERFTNPLSLSTELFEMRKQLRIATEAGHQVAKELRESKIANAALQRQLNAFQRKRGANGRFVRGNSDV